MVTQEEDGRRSFAPGDRVLVTEDLALLGDAYRRTSWGDSEWKRNRAKVHGLPFDTYVPPCNHSVCRTIRVCVCAPNPRQAQHLSTSHSALRYNALHYIATTMKFQTLLGTYSMEYNLFEGVSDSRHPGPGAKGAARTGKNDDNLTTI